ncbi:uncharacterized protein GBIM_18211 [Gryllus bimaculatus]|nr:uncharacterized protein GBIM_18211 [Gryllus bimaculatus]
MSVTRELYKFGASSIASLQSRLPNSDGFFFTITKVSDPAYAFSVLVPLAAGIHTLLAADLLVASLVAEWSNTLLKWLLMEDRPYWWVREVELTGLRTPTLRQTPLTCETGPGSPSGHVMGATAVMYVLREWIEHYYIIPHEDLSAYWFQRALGIDPQWSVRLAFKWCEHAEYLHVDTTPLYSLVRDSGAAIGVALSSPVHRPQVLRGSYVIRIGLAGATVLLFQSLSSAIPTQQAVVFYLLHCLLQGLQAWALLWLLPKIANLLPWQPRQRQQSKKQKLPPKQE